MPRRANPRPTRKAAGKPDLYSSWLKNLKTASKTRLVLVQSKKAHDVLKSLGVKGTIYYSYPKYKPEYKLIDFLTAEGKEVILLFDADRKSNAVCEKLKGKLDQNGIKTNTRFRKVLFGCECKDLAGMLKFLHGHVEDTPRKT